MSWILLLFLPSSALTPIFLVMRPKHWNHLFTWTWKEVLISPYHLQNSFWNLPFMPWHNFFQFLSLSRTVPSAYSCFHLLLVQQILSKTKENKQKTKLKTKLKFLFFEGRACAIKCFSRRGKSLCSLILMRISKPGAHVCKLVGWG